MQKFLIDRLFVISQSIRVLGQNDLTSVIMYSEIGSLIWRSAIWTLGIFSLQFESSDVQEGLVQKLAHIFLSTYSTLGYGLDLCKILIIFGIFLYKIDSHIFIKKFLVVCFILFEDNCFMIDMITTKHYMPADTGLLIAYSGVSTVICSTIRLFADLAMCNFSFNYNHKSKRIPLIKIKILQSITQEVTCIFLMVMKNRKDPSYFIIFTILFLLNFLTKANYIYSLPFSSSVISKLRMTKFVIWSSFIFSFIFSHTNVSLIKENIWIIFFTFNILWLIVSTNYQKVIKEKMLITDIKTISNWKQANIKLQYYYQIISEEKAAINKITALLQFHIKDCKKVDCYCRKQNQQNYRNPNNLPQAVALKYFLLILCQQTADHFQYKSTPQIYRLLGLSLLNIYPKMLYHSTHLEQSFSSLKIIDKVMNKYLRWEVLDFIDKKNKKERILNIDVLQQIQNLQAQLVVSVKKVAKCRQKLFQTLTNNSVFSQNILKMLNLEVEQRNKTEQIFDKIKQIPYLQSQSMKLMIIYSRYIVENPVLQHKVKIFISEQKGCRSFNGDENLKQINQLIKNSNNTCFIKFSLINLGTIEWHNSNIFKVFNLQKNATIIGQNIDILIPSFFKRYHLKIMANWESNPSDFRLKNFSDTFIEVNSQTLAPVTLCLKIIPQMQQYNLFCLVSKQQKTEIMLLNSNLQLVYPSPYLNKMLNEEEITISSPINFGLISQQFQSLLTSQIPQIQSILQFDLFIPPSYDDYYNIFQEQLSKLDPSIQTFNQSYKLLLRRIHLKMRSSRNMLAVSLKSKLSTIDSKTPQLQIPRFFAIKQVQPNSTEKSEDNHSISQQISVNTYSEQQILTTNSSTSQSARHAYQRIINYQKLTNNVFSRTMKIIFTCIAVYMILPPISVYTEKISTNQVLTVYNASISINHLTSLCKSSYDMAMILDYHLRTKAQKNYNMATLLFNQITDLVQSTKQYSYDRQNEYVMQFLFSDVKSNDGRKQSFILWVQIWTRKIESLLKYYNSNQTFIAKQYQTISSLGFQLTPIEQILFIKIQQTQSWLLYINIFITILLMLVKGLAGGSYEYYVSYVNKYKFEMIKLLEQIDFSTISQYINFYKFSKKNIWNIDQQKANFFDQGTKFSHNKPKFIKNKNPLQGKIIILIIILTFVTNISVVIVISNENSNSISTFCKNFKLQESKHYLSQSLSELKQVMLGMRNISQAKNLNFVASDAFNHQIPSLKGALLLDNLSSRHLVKFINSVCSIVSSSLTAQQKSICKSGFTYRIIDTGLLSLGDYITNNIRRSFYSLSSQTAAKIYSDSHLIDSTLSMFYIQKLLFSFQNSTIRHQIKNQRTTLQVMLWIYFITSLITTILILYRVIMFCYNQKKQWKLIYKLLMIIPEKVSRQNKRIQVFLSNLKKQNTIN